jgi:hypothetical protein
MGEKTLHFIYYDLPEPIRWWFGGGRNYRSRPIMHCGNGARCALPMISRFLAAVAEHEIAERGGRLERHLAEARLPLGASP